MMSYWLLSVYLTFILYGLSVAIRAFIRLWQQNSAKPIQGGSGVAIWDVEARQLPEEVIEGELVLELSSDTPAVLLNASQQKLNRLLAIMQEVNVDPRKALKHPMAPALVTQYCNGRMNDVEAMRAFRNLLIFSPGLALNQNRSVDTFE